MARLRNGNGRYIRFFTISVVAVFIALSVHLGETMRDPSDIGSIPVHLFILITAVLGSIVNQPFRQENLNEEGPGFVFSYMLWKCTVSIVFAFFLYTFFMGGFLRGDLFPDFQHLTGTGDQYSGIDKFVSNSLPSANKDFAKLLVWSFIAGYSERFVPNLISQLTKDVVSVDEE